MSARKAQTRRSFGTLGKADSALLERAEVIAQGLSDRLKPKRHTNYPTRAAEEIDEDTPLRQMLCAGFAVALFGLALFSTPARATESIAFDGAWWQAMSRDEKLLALEGMPAVFDQSANIRTAKGNLNPNPPRFSNTFGTYIDEISAFYEEHPKRLQLVTPADLLSFCFADNSTTKRLASAGITCVKFGAAADSK